MVLMVQKFISNLVADHEMFWKRAAIEMATTVISLDKLRDPIERKDSGFNNT